MKHLYALLATVAGIMVAPLASAALDTTAVTAYFTSDIVPAIVGLTNLSTQYPTRYRNLPVADE